MLKNLAARIGATVTAAAVVGSVFAAIPTSVANAISECDLSYPQARTTTTVSAPYGVSASAADLITVKVINTTGQTCFEPIVVIYPREGTVFHSIVSTTGGWLCKTPPIGEAGFTSCINENLAPNSATTIRVRYNRVSPGSPVSGTASSELILTSCRSVLGGSSVCAQNN